MTLYVRALGATKWLPDPPNGTRFGRLTVIGPSPSQKYPNSSSTRRHVACRCDCGVVTAPALLHLRGGKSKSCGCLRLERRTTHGLAAAARNRRHPLYQTWRGMRARCRNPRSADWPKYGGRGITVCERWHSFVNFLADIGERPSPDHSIDRIDNDQGYEPGNVRWATNTEQARNRRSNKLTSDLVREIHGRIEHGESSMSVARRMGVSKSTVNNIVSGRAWIDIHAEGRAPITDGAA